MRSTFTFNGHSCDEFGIYISKKPNINRSQRKFQSASVAGRNGNIYQLQDAWDEVVVTYDIFAGGYEQGDAPSDFTDIMEWLNSADDYARLEDSYDTEHYRMAVFVDATNIEQKWYSTGQAQIKFRCKPQHFLDIPDVDVNNLRNYYMGEIVSFDGDGQNLENLTAEIKAVQDLHGYDHPWAGGSGKNLCPYPFQDGSSKTTNGITFTANADGSIKINGTATAVAQFFIKTQMSLKAGTYTLSGFPSTMPAGANTYMRVYSASASFALSDFSRTKTERTRTLSQDVTDVLIWVSIASGDTINNVTIYPMLELGSTASSFAPYSNICPISGWDEVNVNVRGKNLWTGDSFITKATGNFYIGTGNTLASAYPISIPKGTIYFSADWQGVGAGQEIQIFYADGTKERFGTNPIPANSHFERSVTLEKDAVGIFAYINQAGTLSNVMLTYEENADYEPYNGQTYTIDLDGTRYGGTLDVTTGVLTLTHGIKEFDGTESFTLVSDGTTSRRFVITLSGTSANGICSHGKMISSNTGTWGEFRLYSTGNFAVLDGNSYFADATSLKSYLTAQNTSGTPLTVCYELATPQVVQLTPTQVKTLVGENNIWVDSGEVDVVTAPSIANPTNHVALPIITLTGAGASSLLDLEKDSPDHNESGMPYYFSELLPCFGAVLTGMSGSQRYVSMFTDAYAAVDKLQIASRQNSTGSVVFTALNDEYGVGTAIEVNPNTDYTISATTDKACTVQVLFFTGVVGLITSEAHASNNGGGLQLTFRTPSDCQKILIAFFASDTSQITVGSIMVNKGTEALPFRAFTTDTSETITIKDTTLKILMNGFKTAVIDCERENFSVDGADSNTSVSVLDQYGNLSDEYLKIDKGRNKVAYSDGIVSVMLKPRFWEL